MRDDKDRSLGRASLTSSMRDWPQTLRRNAAVVELAGAIFKARGEAFGGATDLSEQPAHVRGEYVTRADELLKTLAPKPPATVAPFRRLHHGL